MSAENGSVKFGDVVNEVTRHEKAPLENGLERYVGLDHLDPYNLTVRRWGDIREGTTFTKRFEPGQVLFGKRRCYQKKAAVAKFSGLCSGDIIVLKAQEEKLIPELLPFLVQSDAFFKWAEKTSSGSLSPRTKFKALAEFEFPLPSKDRQREILELLQALENSLRATEDAIESGEQLKRSMMAHLLTKGTGHSKFKKTDIGEIPKEWTFCKLEDCSFIQTGVTLGKKWEKDVVKVPYLRVANIQDGFLDLGEVKEIAIDRSKISRYQLQKDDVLLTEGGDFDKLGRGHIWPGTISPCLHQNHVFCVRLNKKVMRPVYFNYLKASAIGKHYFLSCAKQTTNLASINLTQLKAFPCPIPNCEEQARIVGHLQHVDDSILHLRKNVKCQRKLKELFNEWVIGGHSMPFGKDSERHYREQRQCKTVSRVDQ